MTAVDQVRELGPGADGAVAVAPTAGTTAREKGAQAEVRWRQLPRWGRLAGAAVLLGGLYALGALLPFWFLTLPAAGAAFFPSAGLTLAALLLTPRRTWPLWLTAVAVAEVSVDLTHGQTVPMALGFAVANTAEPLLGAAAMVALLRWARSLRGRMVLYVAFAVVLGPLVGGVIGGAVATWWGSGAAWWPIAGRWWLGDALGVLVVATPILAWARPLRWEPRTRALEVALTTAVATAAVLVPALVWKHPLVYAVLPVLMWGAVRGGIRTVSVAGLGVAFAVDWAAVTGRAEQLVAAGTRGDQLVQVQLFLGVTLLAALILAVEVTERRRAEAELLSAEQERHRAERAVIVAAATERRRVAADIHDVVGHALNVVLLQAGAARRSVDGDADLARELLESIEATGRHAFRDLDLALGLVDRTERQGPGSGLGAVPQLVHTMRQAGLSVELDAPAPRPDVSTIVDRSAYRVVREALTNVAKHAPEAHAVVRVGEEGSWLVVTVTDDGKGTRPADRAADRRVGGRGLLGLRERVAVLGGDLDAGPLVPVGFFVRAALPLLGERP